MRILLSGVLVAVVLVASTVACGETAPREDPWPNETTQEDLAAPRTAIETAHYETRLHVESSTIDGSPIAFDLEMDGDYVAPDTQAAMISVRQGAAVGSAQLVIVGHDAWFRRSDEPWIKTDSDDVLVKVFERYSPFPGFKFSATTISDIIYHLDSAPELIDGLPTHRFEVTPEEMREVMNTLTELSSGLGDETQEPGGLGVLFWIADDMRSLFRVQARGQFPMDESTGTIFGAIPNGRLVDFEVTQTITRFNDVGIAVATPGGAGTPGPPTS